MTTVEGNASSGQQRSDSGDGHCGPTDTPDDIDIPALREKYRVEREKRLRPEGATQYQELKGEFAEFAEVDPHTPVTPRAPISEDVEVVVLGGGFAGLLAGSYLKKAGVDDVRIIEMGGGRTKVEDVTDPGVGFVITS